MYEGVSRVGLCDDWDWLMIVEIVGQVVGPLWAAHGRGVGVCHGRGCVIGGRGRESAAAGSKGAAGR